MKIADNIGEKTEQPIQTIQSETTMTEKCTNTQILRLTTTSQTK